MKKLSDYNDSGYKDYIDLHIHSNSSDGTLHPYEILSRASFLGLKAISITDHDTMEGCKLLMKFSSIPSGIKFISGVEVSASPPLGFGIVSSVHILGYGMDPYNTNFSKYLKSLEISRINRAREMIHKLDDLGLVLNEKEVFDEANGGVVGRPHFARLMVKKGFTTSFKHAFDRFLGQNKPAYIKKANVRIEDVISFIRNAGGVAVLAHPYLLGIKKLNLFRKFVALLKSMGLSGLEAIYPEHPKHIIDFYTDLSRSNKLIITGGTDFHGDNSTGSNLGIGKGKFYVPFKVYKNLVKLINGNL